MKEKKIKFFIFVAFCIFITAILSPLASNDYLRNDVIHKISHDLSQDISHDLVNHTVAVFQAKMALDEGQFPVRTAPGRYKNYGLPLFQFYSPVFYTVAGAINKFVVPQNPYIALKITLWLSLLLGTWFFHRLVFWFTKSHVIAFLSATVYVMSPYLLLNIFGRGAITEAVGQGILPIVLFYSLKIYFSSKKVNFAHIILGGISWFALLGIHLITFLYLSLFLGLFLFIVTILNRNYFKSLLFVGMSYAIGLFLGCYYIMPIAFYSKFLLIGAARMLEEYFFLTPLSSMLSIAPTSPMPLPGNGLLPAEQKVYLSFGLPILVSVGCLIYIIMQRKNNFKRQQKIISFILLILFFVCFFLIWTPFNFWSYLPQILKLCQFPYRLFAQTMWIGTLIFALVLFVWTKQTLKFKHAIVGVMLICLSTRQWITTQDVGKSISVSEIMSNTDIGYGKISYLIAPASVNAMKDSFTQSFSDTSSNCSYKGKKTVCMLTLSEDIKNIIQLPIFYYPNLLNITANGKSISYFPTKFSAYTMVGIELPKGNYKIESYFQGVAWANWVSVFSWLVILSLLLFV